MKVEDLKGQQVLMAVSGGLDSCTITHWLVAQGVGVVAYTADLGQPDEKNISDVRDRMLACGASEMILDDCKEAICQAGIQLVQAQARYEGGYWNTTGIARHVTVAGILPHMQQRGIKIMGHGATGRGNDQVRFQLAAQMLAPQVEVYAPWRDPGFLATFGGRKEMIDYCQDHGITVETHYSPNPANSEQLSYAHQWEADLMVVGNSARNLLMRKLFGETALHVMRHADRAIFMAQ